MTSPYFPDLSFQDNLSDELARARRDGIVIFGSGNFARALKVALDQLGAVVKAFVVSQGEQTTLDGVPVLPIADAIQENGCRNIWIGIFNHQPNANYLKLSNLCQSLGFEHILGITQYFELVASQLGWRFWLSDRSDYAAHASELQAAFEQLEDDESKRLFADTLTFRLGKSMHVSGTPCSDVHYFPDFITQATQARAQPLAMIDGGAYDGDTIATALVHLPLTCAYAFEPDPSNFRALAQRAKHLPMPVMCVPCGLSSTAQTLRFATGQGEASAISADSGETIQVVSIDECLPTARVDFLKLDVEGHEMEALQGAIQCIQRHRPVLAIAGYHRASDFWRIPKFIGNLNLGYRIRLRIHTENSFDAVFYAY